MAAFPASIFTVADVRCEPARTPTGLPVFTVTARVHLAWWAEWWLLLFVFLPRAVRAYRRLLSLQFRTSLRKALAP